jgi:hypothetical protein
MSVFLFQSALVQKKQRSLVGSQVFQQRLLALQGPYQRRTQTCELPHYQCGLQTAFLPYANLDWLASIVNAAFPVLIIASV